WPERVYQFHEEGFDLPRSATLLAAGTVFENQAFRYGAHDYGVQFHPELTLPILRRWGEMGARRLGRPGAQVWPDQLALRRGHDAACRRWLSDFLDLWLGPAPPGAPPREAAAGR